MHSTYCKTIYYTFNLVRLETSSVASAPHKKSYFLFSFNRKFNILDTYTQNVNTYVRIHNTCKVQGIISQLFSTSLIHTLAVSPLAFSFTLSKLTDWPTNYLLTKCSLISLVFPHFWKNRMRDPLTKMESKKSAFLVEIGYIHTYPHTYKHTYIDCFCINRD